MKQKKKKILTKSLAATLIMSLSFTSLAIGPQKFNDGKSHEINEDIIYVGPNGGKALWVSGNGTSVTVNGNIFATDSNALGIVAYDTNTIVVNGNINSAENAICAYDNSDITVTGNIWNSEEYGTISAQQKAKITVEGDVVNKNQTALDIYDDAQVKVTGNVEGGTAIAVSQIEDLEEGSVVDIDGHVSGKEYAIVVYCGTDVNIRESVTSKGLGVLSAAGSDVKNNIVIDKNLTVTAQNDVAGWYGGIYTIHGNNEVTVKGNLLVKNIANNEEAWAIDTTDAVVNVGSLKTDGNGVWAQDNSKTFVNGNFETGEEQIAVRFSGDDPSSVLIGKNLKATGNMVIELQEANEESELAVGGTILNSKGLNLRVSVDENGVATNLPEIVVGNIQSINRIAVTDNTDVSVSEETAKQVVDHIKYIVASDSNSTNGKGTIQITRKDGSALNRDKSNTYYVADTYETLMVYVDVDDGYEVKNMTAGKSLVAKNSDGSYSVTVQPGGDVTIKAEIGEKNVNVNKNDKDNRKERIITPKPIMSENGEWIQDGNVWFFKKEDGTFIKNRWSYLAWNDSYNWYYFNESGQMQTGWILLNNIWYYCYPISDGRQGFMYTGWNLINGNWYYFSTVKDSTEGMMYANTITPDGYAVGSNGAWVH